jgi:hypothetical protein
MHIAVWCDTFKSNMVDTVRNVLKDVVSDNINITKQTHRGTAWIPTVGHLL